jgi:hypothetical protein
MILRQYRADQLPGLLYSIYPPRQAVTTDLSSIGQKSNKKNKVTAADRLAIKTIKKAGIEGNENGDVQLVIQVLDLSQEVTGSPATGECILWSVAPLVKTLYSPPHSGTSAHEAQEKPEDGEEQEEVRQVQILLLPSLLLSMTLTFSSPSRQSRNSLGLLFKVSSKGMVSHQTCLI